MPPGRQRCRRWELASWRSLWSSTCPIDSRCYRETIATTIDRIKTGSAQAVLVDRLLRRLGLDLAAGGELDEGGQGDRLGVDVEPPPQRGPGVRPAVAVGAQRRPVVRHPLRDLVRHGPHPVAD